MVGYEGYLLTTHLCDTVRIQSGPRHIFWQIICAWIIKKNCIFKVSSDWLIAVLLFAVQPWQLYKCLIHAVSLQICVLGLAISVYQCVHSSTSVLFFFLYNVTLKRHKMYTGWSPDVTPYTGKRVMMVYSRLGLGRCTRQFYQWAHTSASYIYLWWSESCVTKIWAWVVFCSCYSDAFEIGISKLSSLGNALTSCCTLSCPLQNL